MSTPSASAPAGIPLVSTQNLSRHFRGVKALDGVTMYADEREIVGIIGPNGAGKTTLFNCVAGVFPPTAGTITFKNANVSKMPPYRRCRMGVSRTFQLIQPFVSLTVLENITVAGTAQGMRPKAAREQAGRLIETLGLGGIAHRKGADVNAVEGKRLELGRALASRPSLILLDEIFTGLNGDEVDDLVAIVAELPAQGLTVLLIEHNVAAIRSVTQRVVAIDAGKVVSEGTPDHVLSDPRVVESYLGQRTRT